MQSPLPLPSSLGEIAYQSQDSIDSTACQPATSLSRPRPAFSFPPSVAEPLATVVTGQAGQLCWASPGSIQLAKPRKSLLSTLPLEPAGSLSECCQNGLMSSIPNPADQSAGGWTSPLSLCHASSPGNAPATPWTAPCSLLIAPSCN